MPNDIYLMFFFLRRQIYTAIRLRNVKQDTTYQPAYLMNDKHRTTYAIRP